MQLIAHRKCRQRHSCLKICLLERRSCQPREKCCLALCPRQFFIQRESCLHCNAGRAAGWKDVQDFSEVSYVGNLPPYKNLGVALGGVTCARKVAGGNCLLVNTRNTPRVQSSQEHIHRNHLRCGKERNENKQPQGLISSSLGADFLHDKENYCGVYGLVLTSSYLQVPRNFSRGLQKGPAPLSWPRCLRLRYVN